MNFLRRKGGAQKEAVATGGNAVAAAAPTNEKGRKQARQEKKDPAAKKPAKAGAAGRETPKTVRGAQSALKPGNNSGFVKQKEHPIVQFGPVLKEFLGSKELVNKEISLRYYQKTDTYEGSVTFQRVLDNGVSVSAIEHLSFEEYIAQRKTILKVKDDATHFVRFVGKLLEWLGIDLTAAKPQVQFKSVENFVLKHLSPVEKGIIVLSDDEYNQLDTAKIPGILSPSISVINAHYGGMQKRTEFLIKMINSTGPVADMKPPNWVERGVSGISKAVLLETLKIQHVPKLSEEQIAALKAMNDILQDPASDQAQEEEKTPGAAE